MSPTAALHDPVFRVYAGIVFALLVFGGALLGLLHFVFSIQLGSVWKTYRAWLWMAPLAALFVFAGRAVFILGVTALGVMAAKEFCRGSKLDRDRWIIAAVFAGIVGSGMAALIERDFTFVPIGALLLMALVAILRNRSRPGELQRLSSGTLAFVLFGWMLGHLALLANTRNAYGYLCFVLFATEVNDVAGFTFGKIFGRHPLRSGISPRKTWEGALGALALSLALPWLLRFSFPFFGPWQLLFAGLIVGIGGPLGDLLFSAIKRDLGLKDWSAAIPGHGGVLDRIDSLIFVAPLFMLLAGYYDLGR